MSDQKIQWQPIIELSIVLFTILGSTIPLYIHTDAKIDAAQARTDVVLNCIREEMKEFHGRLERQDAEFKAYLMYGKEKRE